MPGPDVLASNVRNIVRVRPVSPSFKEGSDHHQAAHRDGKKRKRWSLVSKGFMVKVFQVFRSERCDSVLIFVYRSSSRASTNAVAPTAAREAKASIVAPHA